MKAVFTEENYVQPTIYLSLELIYEIRWGTANTVICWCVCPNGVYVQVGLKSTNWFSTDKAHVLQSALMICGDLDN